MFENVRNYMEIKIVDKKLTYTEFVTLDWKYYFLYLKLNLF